MQRKRRWVLGAVAVILAVGLAVGAVDVTQVHLGWSQDDVYTTMTVVWHSQGSLPGRVEYWPYSSTGLTTPPVSQTSTVYQIQPTQATNGSPMSTTGFSGFYHRAELTGLSPGHTNAFGVVDAAGDVTREWQLRTIGASQNVTFAFAGDSQRPYVTPDGPCGQLVSRPTAPANWPYMRDFLTTTAANSDPDFILGLGDFVSRGNDQDQWGHWFEAFEDRAVTSTGRMIPIVPVIGNHDLGGYPDIDSSYEWFLGLFAVPNPVPGKPWYSLSFPNLHLTVLSATARHVHGGMNDANAEAAAQNGWLRQDLRLAMSGVWRVVAFHYNYLGCFDACTGYPSDAYMKAWASTFQRYGVDMVMMGHTHNYTRTWPVSFSRGNPCGGAGFSPQLMNASSDGITYIVHGGWGAVASSIISGTGCDLREWMAAAAGHPSMGFVQVSASGLSVQVKDTASTLLDSFQLPYTTAVFTVPGYVQTVP